MQYITDAAVDAADIFGGQITPRHIREMLENAQPSILAEELAPYRARLVDADRSLQGHISIVDRSPEDVARLIDQAERVRLAMSYLDEIIRSL